MDVVKLSTIMAIALTGLWQTEQVVEVFATPLTLLTRLGRLHTDCMNSSFTGSMS